MPGAHPIQPRLGAHLSIAGGLPRAAELATQLRATALQVFVKSARQWNGRALDAAEAVAFREALERRDLAGHTLAHASYLINLASPDSLLLERSVLALGDELERCHRLGIPYLVVHPGSHLGSGEAAALRRIARGIDRLFTGRGRAKPFGEVMLLLELTAGQGSSVGHRFEHLASILEYARARDRLGVCFDTCHAFAAGYDLRDEGSYRGTFAVLERTVGLDRVRAFHLNDSRTELGSRVDRHEHIGRGRLGLEAFGRILNDPRFAGRPMVLETPKGRGLFHDRRNLRLLRGLVQ